METWGKTDSVKQRKWHILEFSYYNKVSFLCFCCICVVNTCHKLEYGIENIILFTVSGDATLLYLHLFHQLPFCARTLKVTDSYCATKATRLSKISVHFYPAERCCGPSPRSIKKAPNSEKRQDT